jgi:hypothetical protein
MRPSAFSSNPLDSAGSSFPRCRRRCSSHLEFEQSLLEWASELGVQCKIIEHRHLLITQVGFTVTGPKRKLDEFSEGVKAEEWMTIRTETQVMLGPI